MGVGSTGYLPSIDYTARDFDTIQAALLSHVKNFYPNDWQDYTASNLGMCILDLVAYVGDQLSFYLDRVANELFLPTVVQRSNAINLVSLLGYVPRSTSAAVASIQMTLATSQAANVDIGAYTKFQDEGGETWEFLENIVIPAGRTNTTGIAVTDEVLATADGSASYSLITANDNLSTSTTPVLKMTISSVPYSVNVGSDGSVILPYGGTGILDYEAGTLSLAFNASSVPDAATDITLSYEWDQDISAYHGRTRVQQFTTDGTGNQSFTLTNTPVLVSPRSETETVTPNPNRFEVWFGDPAAPFGNATGTLWSRVDSLVSAGSGEKVYELSVDDQDRVTVRFGDNINGAAPSPGTINVIYRTGGGTVGNVATGYIDTSVTGQVGLFAVTVDITNYKAASGGEERESLNEIRVNAPAYFRTNDTATTEQDYDALALYSQAGLGSITRAKSRLTPSEELTTYTVHTDVVLGTIPISTPLEYYLILPAAPLRIRDAATYPTSYTPAVSYTVSGVARTASATDLGSGLANLTGAGGTVDSANTRWRYDQQDYEAENPTGYVGDGTTVSFTGQSLTGFPVFPGSVLFSYTIAGTDYVGYDDTAGNLVGVNVHADSSIDYDTGDVDVHFGDPAELTSGNAGTYNLNAINGGLTVNLDINIDGSGVQTIALAPADFTAFAAATPAEVVAVLTTGGAGGAPNALSGATASVDGTSVKIVSDTYGVASSIDVDPRLGGDDANDATNGLNFSTTAVTGTSYAPDAASVVAFDYQSCMHLVLNFAPDAGTEVLISAESGPNTQELPTNNVEVYTWSQDANGDYISPSSSLRDHLKSYLDLRRVLGTSVEVLPGKVVKVHYHLTVEFDPSISSTDTSAEIVSAIESYFEDVTNVNAGYEVPLAAIYDAVYPLQGVVNVVAQDVGLQVPIGVGNALTALFKDQSDSPGEYIASGRLPMVTGTGNIKVYVGGTIAGESDASSSPASILAVSGAAYQTLSGSEVDESTGDFTVKLTPAPASGEIVYLDFLLDEQAALEGISIWNIDADEWEILALGDVYVNGTKVN